MSNVRKDVAHHHPYELSLRAAREHFSASDATQFYLGELERLAHECGEGPNPPNELLLEKLIFLASYLYFFEETRYSYARAIAEGTLTGRKVRRFTAQDAFKNGMKAGYKDARAGMGRRWKFWFP
jgi:hypothetical protein